jgi:four helix bundle protein
MNQSFNELIIQLTVDPVKEFLYISWIMSENSHDHLLSLPEQFKNRTKQFAIRIVKLYRALPKTGEAKVVGNQILRSGTSVAANYRAVCRARSRAEFISKMGIVIEETDETVFWLEMLIDTQILSEAKLKDLLKEANELLAVFASSQRTAKSHSTRFK